MNTTLKLLLMLTLTPFSINAQDASAVEQTITRFIHAGDTRDVDSLQEILHEGFRTVAPGQTASLEIRIIPKEKYLELLRDKKIGGDERTLHILSVDIENNRASAKAETTGKAVIFQSYYHLLKTSEGHWQLINDFTVVVPR
jgi:Putative lumazine-binding